VSRKHILNLHEINGNELLFIIPLFKKDSLLLLSLPLLKGPSLLSSGSRNAGLTLDWLQFP